MSAPTRLGADVTLWTSVHELLNDLANMATPGGGMRLVGDLHGRLVDVSIPGVKPTTEEIKARAEAAKDQSMPAVGVAWTVIDPSNPATLPTAGDWLVTVDNDLCSREVFVLEHVGEGAWLYDGQEIHDTCYAHPIAWAPRPEAYSGPVLSED